MPAADSSIDDAHDVVTAWCMMGNFVCAVFGFPVKPFVKVMAVLGLPRFFNFIKSFLAFDVLDWTFRRRLAVCIVVVFVILSLLLMIFTFS